MKEIVGNFWDNIFYYEAIVCPTNTTVKSNGDLVMGAGLARDFAERYPFLPKLWGNQVNRLLNEYRQACVMINYYKESHYPSHIAFPTKYNYNYCSPLPLIKNSTEQMVSVINALDIKSVLMTRPGCGLGNRLWETEVKPILKDRLDDRFTIINPD